MKHLIVYISFFISGFCFSQNDVDFNYPSIEGDFMVKQIIGGRLFNYINIENSEGIKILIMQYKPKKKILKKNSKNPNIKKIEVGKSYYFELASQTWNMGFLDTGGIVNEEGVEIWNRKTCDFNVCYAHNLQGLYYIPK